MIDFFYDSYRLILFFLIPGIFLGAVYDIFRILRIARTEPNGIYPFLCSHFRIQRTIKVQNEQKKYKILYILVLIEDIFFCLIVALTEILLFYYLNHGVIRIYGLILSAIGFILYRSTIGYCMIRIAKQIIVIGRWIIRWTLIILLTPMITMFKTTKRILFKCKKNIKTKQKKEKKDESQA